MKTFFIIAVIILCVAALSFIGGSRWGARAPQDIRDVETVRMEEDMGAEASPGTVNISYARQQLIGVKVAAVEKTPVTYNLRLYGRVQPDETKIYRLNASTDSWMREISSAATGSLVEKNEILAEVLAPVFFNAQSNYVIQLGQMDRIREQLGGEIRPQQTEIADNQIRMAVQSLQTIGVSDAQIAELAKTRKARPYLQVRAPARGVILSRKVTLNQWFKAGDEFYTIADIRKVWVYADVYEDEAIHMKPGMTVAVKHGQTGKIFNAKISKVLPLFESSARTLKVRIDVDNPRYDLRPDMFVDVEIPITMPASLHIPADALIDTGNRAVVYVEKGKGIFEPRRVATGWNLGRQVEITHGLSAGEKVVVSGTFLIDSESRMALAASGAGTDTSDGTPGKPSVERRETTDWAAVLKGKSAPDSIKARSFEEKKSGNSSPNVQIKAVIPTKSDDLEGYPEGKYPFVGAHYLGTVQREPAHTGSEPKELNDSPSPGRFELREAPPSDTRLK